MQYDFISTRQQLARFCDEIAAATSLAFDTEFVSENSYRPQLCLVQIAAAGRLAVVDPLAMHDLAPLWDLLVQFPGETIVHAGREELCFMLRAVNQAPRQLFDTQIAGGLIGLEYPAAYSTLVSKLLGVMLTKGETRTDWSRRPLSKRQLEYALQDVVHLEQLRDALRQRLQKFGREAWLSEELKGWQAEVEAAEISERWRRISGVSNLSRQGLAIARELWRWREAEAKRRDCPARHVLRDDLLVELSRRGTADVQHIHAVRGLDRSNKRPYLPEMSQAIEQALQLPQDEWPRHENKTSARSQLNLIGQFMASALNSICHKQHVAAALVGTAQDVRDLIAYRLNMNGAAKDGPPLLATGWREEVVGRTIEELLEGKLAVRIEDPLSDHPLRFEPR